MTKIVVTGGSGRFGSELKKYETKYKIYFLRLTNELVL